MPYPPHVEPHRKLILKMLSEGKRVKEICEAIKTKHSNLHHWAMKNGIQLPCKSHIDPRKQEVLAMLEQGKRPHCVARLIGVNETTLKTWMNKNNVVAQPTPKNGTDILTENEPTVRQMIAHDGKTMKDVSEQMGVPLCTVKRFSKRKNIRPVRFYSTRHDEIVDLAKQNLKVGEMSKVLKCRPSKLAQYMRRNGIVWNKRHPTGKSWIPKWVVGKQKYRIVQAPIGHPARKIVLKGYGRILEHRLVMEQHLGRYLLPSEVVHHVNGQRRDNRVCNLYLFESQSLHSEFHMLCETMAIRGDYPHPESPDIRNYYEALGTDVPWCK